jgi:hypothetical protein
MTSRPSIRKVSGHRFTRKRATKAGLIASAFGERQSRLSSLRSIKRFRPARAEALRPYLGRPQA